METAAIEAWFARHPSTPEQGSLCTGRRIGDWEVVAFLARGGGGEVYQARHCVSGEALALKFASHTKANRLRHEAMVLQRCHHLSLPRLYGCAEIDEGFVLAEELLEPYPFPRRDATVADFCYALCDVIGYCHKQGLVHRDLKPSNVMRRPSDCSLVVIDFGLAKRCSERGHALPSDLSLTSGGNVMGVGTPGYAAPEQFSGITLSRATDIHAIGVLLDSCFKGRLPFVWRAIIRRATSALPKLRYADTEALCRAVRWRYRKLVLTLVVVCGLLVLFLCILFCLKPTDPYAEPFAALRETQQKNFDYYRRVLDRK